MLTKNEKQEFLELFLSSKNYEDAYAKILDMEYLGDSFKSFRFKFMLASTVTDYYHYLYQSYKATGIIGLSKELIDYDMNDVFEFITIQMRENYI